MDLDLVETIVHEVKSQGVFDEFRKVLIADVDTKPAYQNLHQRVDSNVKKFLSTTKWTPETNKNQLRERMRRYITESGFLDMGVERIVDQVVNPKMSSVFQTRIEEIAYKFLGLPVPTKHAPPPHPPLMPTLPPLPTIPGTVLEVETLNLLPTDLEQVSPDSTASTTKSEDKVEPMDDDEESPPFEPLNMPDNIENEMTMEQNMDLSNTPSPPPEPQEVYKPPLPPPPSTPPPPPGVNDLPPLPPGETEPPPLPPVAIAPPPLPPVDNEPPPLPPIENGLPPLPPVDNEAPPLPPGVDVLPPLPPSTPLPPLPPSLPPPSPPQPPKSPTENKDNCDSIDANICSAQAENITLKYENSSAEQRKSFSESSSVKCEIKTLDIMATINSNDSQLSQVSSDSHLSIDFNDRKSHSPSEAAVNISEEAQMPKFSENSCETNAAIDNQANNKELHFDINKDEIKFEGTERKNSLNEDHVDYNQQTQEEISKAQTTETTILEEVLPPQTQTQTLDSNFYSSLNDSSSAQLCIVEPDDQSISSEGSRPTSSMPLVPQATSSPSPPPSVKSAIEDYNSNIETTASQEPQSSSLKSSNSFKSKKHGKIRDRGRERGSSSSRSHKSASSSHRDHYEDKTKKENERSTSRKDHKRRSSSSSKSGSRHKSALYKSSHQAHSSSHKSEKTETKSSNQSTDSATKNISDPKDNTKVDDDDHYAAKERTVRRKTPDSNDDEEGNTANQNNQKSGSAANVTNNVNNKTKQSEEGSPKETKKINDSTKENTSQETDSIKKEKHTSNILEQIEIIGKETDENLPQVEILAEKEENDPNELANMVDVEEMIKNKEEQNNSIPIAADETSAESQIIGSISEGSNPVDNISTKDNMNAGKGELIVKKEIVVISEEKGATYSSGSEEELTNFEKISYELFEARVEAIDMFMSYYRQVVVELDSNAKKYNDEKQKEIIIQSVQSDDIERNNNEPSNKFNERKRLLSSNLSMEENSNLNECSCAPTNNDYEERENDGCSEVKRQKIEGEFAMSLSPITEINMNVEENTITVNTGDCAKRSKQNTKQRYTCEDLYKPRSSARTNRRRLSPIL